MKSIFWLLAFLFSLVLLAAAYYVTRPGMRTAVDARAPWVRNFLGPYIRPSGESEPTPSRALPADAWPDAAPPSPSVAAPAPPPEPFDLKRLAANRAAWPAKLTLIKAKDFPAVVEGKVVGSLTAPAGTEVGLVTISGGKLGVEYKGGGAWLFVEETDVIERTQAR